jgi:hypothetical protein
MPSEEELTVGDVIGCGDTRLVSVLRLTARETGFWASAEAELIGVVVVPATGVASFTAVADTPSDGSSWSEWLDAHPRLLEAVRARLDADRARRAAPRAAST